MPQNRGSCGHQKALWDSHNACLSCCGCSRQQPCEESSSWLAATWASAEKRRTHQNRKRQKKRHSGSDSCSSSISSYSNYIHHEVAQSDLSDRAHTPLPVMTGQSYLPGPQAQTSGSQPQVNPGHNQPGNYLPGTGHDRSGQTTPATGHIARSGQCLPGTGHRAPGTDSQLPVTYTQSVVPIADNLTPGTGLQSPVTGHKSTEYRAPVSDISKSASDSDMSIKHKKTGHSGTGPVKKVNLDLSTTFDVLHKSCKRKSRRQSVSSYDSTDSTSSSSSSSTNRRRNRSRRHRRRRSISRSKRRSHHRGSSRDKHHRYHKRSRYRSRSRSHRSRSNSRSKSITMPTPLTQPLDPMSTAPNPDTVLVQDASGRYYWISKDPVDIQQDTGTNSPPLSYHAPQDDPLIVEGHTIEKQGTEDQSNQSSNPDRPDETDKTDEALSEVQSEPPKEPYLCSLHTMFECIFASLPTLISKPVQSSTSQSTVSVTEKLARSLYPDRPGPDTRSEVKLPISANILQNVADMDNNFRPTKFWAAPHGESKASESSKSYRAPVPDPSTGLDLSKFPPVDQDLCKLATSKPLSSTPVSIPHSMLEAWELRERKTVGLANHIDIMSAAILQLSSTELEACPEDMRALFIYLSRATQTLAHNSIASMTEMLRIRRDVVLESMPRGHFLQPSIDFLRSAPVTSDTLFGGRISDAISRDREDQLHSALAFNNNSWQGKNQFKRPAAKPVSQQTPNKKGKKSTPSQKSIIPAPAKDKPMIFGKSKGRGKPNKASPQDKPSVGYNRNIPGFRRYSIIGNSPQEFNLKIEDSNLDDDTAYQCQVSPADNEPPLLAEAKLTVLVPPNMPEIVDHPNGSVVAVAYTQDVLQLKCVALNGRPAATIKWYRDGEEITGQSVNYVVESIANDKRENAHNTLTLNPKYPQDNNAKYVCKASNDALISGPLSVMVQLSVQFPPGSPQITGYMRDQAVRTGDTIHMVCSSEGGNPLAQVVWYRDDQRMDSSYIQKDNRATNELIFTAKRSDNNAQFRCEAWNVVNQDSPLVETRTLLVHFAPKSVTITGTREARAGENLTLTCTTSNSNPAATIHWIPQGARIIKDETETQPSADGGFITISKIVVTLTEQMTTAIYTCTAQNNKVGRPVNETATVGVLYPPDPPRITGYTEGDAIEAESLLTLTCRATGGNPPATLTWYKGMDVLPAKNETIGNIPSFVITVVVKTDDNGALYRCEATNRATESPKVASKTIKVHFPPAYVRITSAPSQAKAGKKLRLTCISASSNPAAVITWIHNDIPIQGTDMGLTNAEHGGKSSTNVLEMIPTAADHNAVYNCRAKNRALQVTTNDGITLNVLFKPLFEGIDTRIAIEQSQSREINFTANANPPNATYVLKQGNLPLTDSATFTLTGGVLMISSVSKEDQGVYTMEATNTEGTTLFNFTIDVLYAAEIIGTTPGEGPLGTDVELICIVQGNPMVPNMVTWSRSDFDMTRTFSTYENGKGTLRVESLQKTDSGSFTCMADNQIATPAETQIPLTVTFAPEIQKAREHQKAASETGGTGKLICRAEGTPRVDFKWSKDGIQLYHDGTKYEIDEKADPESSIMLESILLVFDVQDSDYGIYTCDVTNSKGTDSIAITFKDKTKPDAPYNIEFVNATYNSITIKWQPSFNGGHPQKYRVRYKESGSYTGYTYVDVDPPESTIFTVKGLSLATKYELTVMSLNLIGGSEYQPVVCEGTTSNLKPTSVEGSGMDVDSGEDTPVIIILVVCVVGIFLLALNIGLILFFVRKRRKRMENGSDTTSHTNTIELYGPSKETALYPMTPSDESRSYGTCDKNEDDFSDDYKSYEHVHCNHRHSPETECVCLKIGKPTSWKDNCCFDPGDDDIKRVFLPPPDYGTVTYSHNKLDSPTFDHRLPIHSTEPKHLYNGSDRSDTDSCRKSPWQYDDPYRSGYRSKGTFDSDCLEDHGPSMNYHEYNGKAGGGRPDIRPKSITELSERSSRPSSRGGYKTPPPPPVRSSSKGAAEHIPPLPARNYGSPDMEPRYVPPPGNLSSFSNNVNVITNPTYDGPNMRSPSPREPTDPTDDMRGHLV